MIEKGLLVLPYTKGLVGSITVEVAEGENGECVGNVEFIYKEGAVVRDIKCKDFQLKDNNRQNMKKIPGPKGVIVSRLTKQARKILAKIAKEESEVKL